MQPEMAYQDADYLGYYPDAELVFAIVCPLGVQHARTAQTLANYLSQFGYSTTSIRLSEHFADLLTAFNIRLEPQGHDPYSKALYKIQAGNRIRESTGKNDILALVASAAIAKSRKERDERPAQRGSGSRGSACVVSSIRRPEEVTTLRRIYGEGFFLVGVNASKEARDEYFREIGIGAEQALALMEIDAKEKAEYGQATRDAFQMADVFLSSEAETESRAQLVRFLDLLFGCPSHAPTPAEHAMFMAYASSLRSADLSRQVGAAIVDRHGDLLAIGHNEAPRSGGGLYTPPVPPANQSFRDVDLGSDSNEEQKTRIAEQVLAELQPAIGRHQLLQALKGAGFFDITEFGRAVHAEMEALFACGRAGRSARGATLFTTTFPCHNCTRHIVAAGIKEVIYIEPYAKSKASSLHSDAISVDERVEGKVPFMPFLGIGPRRYFDLFSLSLSTGYPVERKLNGHLVQWSRSSAAVRLQMKPSSYLEREGLAIHSLRALRSSHG